MRWNMCMWGKISGRRKSEMSRWIKSKIGGRIERGCEGAGDPREGVGRINWVCFAGDRAVAGDFLGRVVLVACQRGRRRVGVGAGGPCIFTGGAAVHAARGLGCVYVQKIFQCECECRVHWRAFSGGGWGCGARRTRPAGRGARARAPCRRAPTSPRAPARPRRGSRRRQSPWGAPTSAPRQRGARGASGSRGRRWGRGSRRTGSRGATR